MKFYPYKKELGRTGFNHAEGGGGTKRFELVSTRKLEVLVILTGGAKGFHSLIGGRAQKVLSCSEGGAISI